jgi:predicted ribosome quality control (RQC) complex YloA/Tae2 family protein
VHQNYYFLKQLAPVLHKSIAGKYFIEAFSQEKDEIILVFADASDSEDLVNPFLIKATLKSDFACLSFPDKFERARKNSVNLFTGLSGNEVDFIAVFENERAIQISFKDNQKLVFKLFGNRSNLIAFDENGNATLLFNNKLAADKSITIESLNRPIDQSLESYVRHDLRHEALFPTFGKLVNTYLADLLKEKETTAEKWEIILALLKKLESPPYYLTKYELIPVLSLIETGEIISEYNDPVEALNAFYMAYVRLNGLEKEKADLLRKLRKRIQQTNNYLTNTFEKLTELENAVKNEEIGNIIMANMHEIPERTEQAELYDFYRDKPILIKFKKDLSAQKNAEIFYRKSKNEKIEIARLNESIEARMSELELLQQHLGIIENMDSLRELRAYVKKSGLNQSKAPVSQDDLFKKEEILGYTILIGRNAKNNDLLTKHYASKEDLWLHAKDVTGSHVIIKNQPGRNFPELVIERAAELAAFYSKRKNDSLCPVIFTPKKYVRKPKGLPDGAVVVDKEDVIMVVAKGS